MKKSCFFLSIALFLVFLNTCMDDPTKLDIQIGDFDWFKEQWDNQNMLDYQLNIELFDNGYFYEVSLTIQNGCLVNPDPIWPKDVFPSTVPEFFSFIEWSVQKNEEQSKTGDYAFIRFHVSYDEVYYYPQHITDSGARSKPKNSPGNSSTMRWDISVVPLLQN
jgi:hypothetical protein